MKRIIGATFVLTLILVSAAAAGTYPQLVGVWEGSTNGYNSEKGFVENVLTFDVKEQKDGSFYGVKTLKSIVSGKILTEKFCGTVTQDGNILATEFTDGYLTGHVDGDTMLLQYVEAGPKAKAFTHTLSRKK